MAVVQISKIQLRRGRKNAGTGLPQLASGEMAWAVDTQELYIGNGAVSEGSPAVGNTKVLTEHDNILDLLNQYEYRTGSIGTGLNGDITTRTLQQRLDEGAVNASSFGISATDATVDQTNLIQNAIYQLFLVNTPNDAVTLQFDPGVYKLTGTVYVPPKVKIIGSGIDTTYFNFVKGGLNSGTTLTLAGTSVSTAGVYTNIASPKITGGSGSGLVLTVAKTGSGTSYIGSGGSKNVTVTIVNSGSGYQAGDSILVLGSALGGANGTNDLTITLSSTALNPTFNTAKVFEFINSTSTATQRNVQSTTNLNQAKNIILKSFTVQTNRNDILAFDFNSVRDSIFEDIKATGTWTHTPSGAVVNSIALKLTATATLITCERNKFVNFRAEGFSYGAYSVTDIINNEFESCVFKTGYEGIRLGDSTIVGGTGPRKNTVTNCLFETISRYGFIVDAGYGNRSRGNTFVNVGNDTGSYPVCGQIKFTTSGNSSLQDYFDRTELSRTRLNDPSLTYYPEVEGHGSYTEFAPATISLPSRNTPAAAFRIPLHNTTGVEVNYVFQSTTYAQMRKGTLSIAVDKENVNWQLVDDFDYVGTGGQETNLTFTADILHNAIVVFYTNTSAGDSDNTFTYTYTITS